MVLEIEGQQGEPSMADKPGIRKYNRRGGRPPLDVDFVAVCDAVLGAWNGSGETMTDIAARFGVSRGWLHNWVYPALDGGVPRVAKDDRVIETRTHR